MVYIILCAIIGLCGIVCSTLLTIVLLPLFDADGRLMTIAVP